MRGLAFDLVAQGVLALVGVGKIGVVEDEQSAGQQHAGEEERQGDAVDADATGFEGHNFVVLAEDTQSDQNGHQRAERRELVEQIRDQIAEVIDNNHKRNVVAGDIVEKLEEGEGLEEQDESAHDEGEVVEKPAEHVDINDTWNAGRRGQGGIGPGGAIFRASDRGLHLGLSTAQQTQKLFEARAGNQARGFAAVVALHARQQGQADEREDDVGDPHARGGRNGALPGQARAHNEEQVIKSDDHNSEQGACRAPTATRLRAERDCDQGKHKASDGKGEALVQFHAGITPALAMVVPKLAYRPLGVARLLLFCWSDAADLDGPIAAAEGGDTVVVGFLAREFVSGAVVEVQLQLALLGLRNYNRTFREGDARTTLPACFSQENAVPPSAAGGDIVDVEDHLGEAFVEDARLHLKRDLRGDEIGLDGAESAQGQGSQPQCHQQGEHRTEHCQNADRPKDAFTADAQSGEGDDFTVHGHAAESQEHADEHGHGDGEDEDVGNDAEEE